MKGLAACQQIQGLDSTVEQSCPGTNTVPMLQQAGTTMTAISSYQTLELLPASTATALAALSVTCLAASLRGPSKPM